MGHVFLGAGALDSLDALDALEVRPDVSLFVASSWITYPPRPRTSVCILCS